MPPPSSNTPEPSKMDNGFPPHTYVTVVIPAYNEEEYIETCIYSILEQTSSDTISEIIVINDGSQDRTQDIVLSLSQKINKIRLISTENRGVAAARNLGISSAANNLVALCDANDCWEKDKLSAQLAFYITHPHRLIYAQRIKYSHKNSLVQGLLPPLFQVYFIICGSIILSPSTWLIDKKQLNGDLFQDVFGEDTVACITSAKSNLIIQQNIAKTIVRLQNVGISADPTFAIRSRLKSLRQITLAAPIRWILQGYEPFYDFIIGMKRGKLRLTKVTPLQALTFPAYAVATFITRLWRLLGA